MARTTRAAAEEARLTAHVLALADDAIATIDREPVVALAQPEPRRTDREQKYADLIQIVQGAETLRFDAQTTVELESQLDAAADLLAQARAQEANREHVNPETLRQLKHHTDRLVAHLASWLLQRGIKDEEGGS